MPNPEKIPRHIFLTGEKKIGKSTLADRALAALPPLRLGGFRTVKVADRTDALGSVYLTPADCPEPECSDESRVCLRLPGDEAPLSFPAVFDCLGARILSESDGCDLILMDEIGIAEASAPRFCAAVERCLNAPVPVLGVLRLSGDTPLQRAIRTHPEVLLLTVTKENRGALAEELPRMLAQRLKQNDTEE